MPENYTLIEDYKKILKAYENTFSKLVDSIDRQNINFYVNFIQEQLFAANKYFNDQEPWNKKNDNERLNTIIYVSLEVIRKISIMLYPVIPDSSLKALNIFNLKEKDVKLETIKKHDFLEKNSKINKIDILFNKIQKND